MKILDSNPQIRQQHPGRFRRPGDGKEPFAHVEDQKIAHPEEVKKASVYIKDVIAVTLENNLKADLPSLFDYDAGVKYDAIDMNAVKKADDRHQSYNQTGKSDGLANKESLFDEWA